MPRHSYSLARRCSAVHMGMTPDPHPASARPRANDRIAVMVDAHIADRPLSVAHSRGDIGRQRVVRTRGQQARTVAVGGGDEPRHAPDRARCVPRRWLVVGATGEVLRVPERSRTKNSPSRAPCRSLASTKTAASSLGVHGLVGSSADSGASVGRAAGSATASAANGTCGAGRPTATSRRPGPPRPPARRARPDHPAPPTRRNSRASRPWPATRESAQCRLELPRRLEADRGCG